MSHLDKNKKEILYSFLIENIRSKNKLNHVKNSFPPPSNLQKKLISDILIDEATFKEQKE